MSDPNGFQDPGSGPANRSHGLEPVDLAISVYLALSGALVLATDPSAGSFVPLGFRVALGIIIAVLRRHPVPEHGAVALVRLAYPIALFPYFYAEIGVLNHLVTASRFDQVVIGWEAAIFGGQPSVTLREQFPSTAVSEYLHLGYLSYYFIPSFTVGALFIGRRLRALAETMTTITLTFITCYVSFILFPVVGPYHTFTPPDPETLGSVFPPLTHAIVRAGSSIGTAFPSSHVAVATAAHIQAFRYDRRAGWVLMAFVPALVLGTVYGGFHYAVDAIAGIMVGVVMNLVGRAFFRVFDPRRPRRPRGSARSGRARAATQRVNAVRRSRRRRAISTRKGFGS